MLNKNTITIRYIKILKNDDGKYWIPKKPLSSSKFAFYVDANVRKQLDIGSVIKTNAHTNNKLMYGVIIDNDTEWKAKDKHPNLAQSQIYTNGHLRTFLSEQYGIARDSRMADRTYHSFRGYSHPYWVKFYADQDNTK